MCLAIIIWLYHARTVLPVIYVRAEEGEPEHGHTAADIVACCLLPAIFHPAVYVISVHFLFLFPPLCLPKQASIYCSLLILKEGWRRQRLFSGQFSYQFTAVFKTRKFTLQNCEFNWFKPHKWMFSLRITNSATRQHIFQIHLRKLHFSFFLTFTRNSLSRADLSYPSLSNTPHAAHDPFRRTRSRLILLRSSLSLAQRHNLCVRAEIGK